MVLEGLNNISSQPTGSLFGTFDPLPEIKTSSFQFILKAQDPLVLPPYKGSTLRGGFGFAFKRVVCALLNQDCPDCLLKEKCLYSYVFETPPPSSTRIMIKYKVSLHIFDRRLVSKKLNAYPICLARLHFFISRKIRIIIRDKILRGIL